MAASSYNIPIRRRHAAGTAAIKAELTQANEWGYDETNEELVVVLDDGTTYRMFSRHALMKPGTENTEVLTVDTSENLTYSGSGDAYLQVDGIVLYFGADDEVSITHTADVGLGFNEDIHLADDKYLQFGATIDSQDARIGWDNSSSPTQLLIEQTTANSDIRIKCAVDNADIILETQTGVSAYAGLKLVGSDFDNVAWDVATSTNLRHLFVDSGGQVRVGSENVLINHS
jgi:hypothetical protein